MLREISSKESQKWKHITGAVQSSIYFDTKKKNGLEDLKKARKNLDWLIEEMENEN